VYLVVLMSLNVSLPSTNWKLLLMHKTGTALMDYSDCCPDPNVHFYFHCTNTRLRLGDRRSAVGRDPGSHSASSVSKLTPGLLIQH
jgi:hypothetical protein